MTDRAPKDVPILFSTPMVLAIENDWKTATRRLAFTDRKVRGELNLKERVPSAWSKLRPGDLLWVRETWAQQHPLAIQDGRFSLPGEAGIPGPPPVNYRVIYRAHGEPLQIWRNDNQEHPYFTLAKPADPLDLKYPTVTSNFSREGKAIHWTTPIHMPRWASRFTLEVTEAHVERLGAMRTKDALAEGIRHQPPKSRFVKGLMKEYLVSLGDREIRGTTAVECFENLWEHIHGEGAWMADKDKDVVAITFRVHKQNIDAFKATRVAA